MSVSRHIRSLCCLALLGFTGFGPVRYNSLAGTQADQAPAGESAAQQEIFNSPAWAAAVDGFNEWLSVQITYPQDQVPQLKAEFKARIDKMSASQLQSFLTDMQQKLAILNGPDAMEARAWAERRLNLYTAARAAEFRKTLPDVARMTAAQVEQALVELRLHRASVASEQQKFSQFRDQQVVATRQRLQAQASAAAAANAASNHPGYQGGSYAPRSNRAQIERYPGLGYGRGFGGWRW